MAFTVTLTELSLFLIAVAFFILVIYLIPAVLQIRQTSKAIEDLSIKGKDLLGEMEHCFKNAVGQAGEMGESLQRFLLNQGGRKIAELAEPLLGKMKSPVITLLGILFGLNIVHKFFRRDRGKEGE